LALENLKLSRIAVNRKRNFEVAQHIDKQIAKVSSAINALQNSTKLWDITTSSFDAAKAENW